MRNNLNMLFKQKEKLSGAIDIVSIYAYFYPTINCKQLEERLKEDLVVLNKQIEKLTQEVKS